MCAMTKADIVEQIATETGLSKVQTKAVVEGVLSSVMGILAGDPGRRRRPSNGYWRSRGTALRGISTELNGAVSRALNLSNQMTTMNTETADDRGDG